MSEPVRLSESHMWHELREFYEDEGVAVWSKDHLPFFATNNPALARTYTDLFIAFVEDCRDQGLLEQNKPLYIVELGGGMGRLAYLILVRLAQLADYLPLSVKYILTDYSSSNVSYYREHEKLKPFLESGALQVQTYDAEGSDSLEMEVGNPIFVIANYLFDSLSHDGFKLHNGELLEARCSRDEDGEVKLDFLPTPEQPYEDESCNAVLDDYRANLGNTCFPFPIGPLRCLNALSRQTQNKVGLIMADKALRSLESLLGFETLPVQKHPRGFSMSVNCHALDQIWNGQDGFVLHSAHRSHPLNLAFYGKGIQLEQARRTGRVFREQIDGFGPLDYLDFRKRILNSSRKTLGLCLQLLRMSCWDAELFYELSNEIGETALAAPLHQQRELYDTLVSCWQNFFSIGDQRDVPFAVARVLACINQFNQAIDFYGESLRLYGAKALTHHNIGLCHYNAGRLPEARAAFQKALKVDENYGASKELLIRLNAESERQAELSP
jgi:putative S-adenosyl-L-methionine-dependent methyltransferase/tetratricopeptide repeat protein